MSVGELVVSIIGDMKALHQAFKDIDTELSGVASSFQTQGAKISSAGSAMTTRITAPIAAATVAIGAATHSALGFETGMAQTFTLLPDLSEEAMSGMSEDMLDFSKEMGVMTNEATPALYQAISASVPKDNVFEFLATAQKAAVGGSTELETSVDGISSVVNAYGRDVIEATEASDLMFTAVKLGKTSFGELSSSLYNVIPYSSAAGVAFSDVTAALSTITAQGTPTTVATTQVRQMLVELSDSGSAVGKVFQEVAGVSFKEFIAQGGNTQQALQLLEGHAATTGVGVDELFGSVEAGAAVLGLTGKSTEKFASDLAAMQDSAGATDAAYKKMNDTGERAIAQIKASLNVGMVELGNEFLPMLKEDLLPIIQDTLIPFLENVALPAISGLVKLFGSLPKPVQMLIIGLVGLLAALGPVLLIVGAMASSVGSIVGLFATGGALAGAGGVVMSLLSAIVPLLPVIALLVGAAMAAYYAFIHWEEIKEIAGKVWEYVKEGIVKIVEYLTGVDLTDEGTSLIDKLKAGILVAIYGVPLLFLKMADGILEKLTGISLYDAGMDLIGTFTAGITDKMSGAYNAVKNGLSDINLLLPHSPAKEGPFKKLPNWDALFVDPVQDSMGNMQATSLNGLQTVAGTIQQAGSSTTNNTFGGNEFSIQSVNLSQDYPFEKFARDMEQYNRQKRIKRGIPS